jgi:Glycosyltransferase family 87
MHSETSAVRAPCVTNQAVAGEASPRAAAARWRLPGAIGAGLGDSLLTPLAALLLLGMAATLALIMIDAAAHSSPLVPPQPHIAHYLKPIGGHKLDFETYCELLAILGGCYVGIVALARQVSRRWLIVAIVGLHLIVFVGPIVLSQDVFSYVAYGRLAVLHGINPFSHGPAAAPHDEVYRYVGQQWRHTPSAYGPVFTLLSYPLAALGLIGAVWAMKVIALASSLGLVALVWGCAERLGRDPLRPTLIVGLNPLLVLYGVGGAHNDLLMVALLMLGVWLALGGRDALGAGAIIAGAAVKATAAVALPFLVLGRRRPMAIAGAAGAVAVIGVVSLAVYGTQSLDLLGVLKREASFVGTDSFPNEVAHLFGLPGVYPSDRALLHVGLVLMLAYLAWRVWRGYDWISGTTIALVAISVLSTWLLAWYTLWALPLGVLARDRRALVLMLSVQALFFVHQLVPLFSPV